MTRRTVLPAADGVSSIVSSRPVREQIEDADPAAWLTWQVLPLLALPYAAPPGFGEE
ncbi:hypothetical protein [Bailinhaonella thermotolerans]|uniref:hypothetical protein n=1 Tax=Bailinhaonella thermotolerans TaxID=1070861 RepID=UPI00192A2355|nr:hypothetical protein [Bailinhaonella thermotolerans]